MNNRFRSFYKIVKYLISIQIICILCVICIQQYGCCLKPIAI